MLLFDEQFAANDRSGGFSEHLGAGKNDYNSQFENPKFAS